MALPVFAELRLRVTDVATIAAWYGDILELPVEEHADSAVVRFFGAQSAALRFVSAAHAPQPGSGRPGFVWVGLANFPDVVASSKSLATKGVVARVQGQFEDVGFVAHMSDCNGTTLELLQTAFESNFKPQPLPATVLKANAILGQAKFNIKNVGDNLRFYCDVLGMKLLSQQPVRYGFTLYFLAFTHDEPPNPDVTAVENCEWLWKKEYTQVELQHFHDSPDIWLPHEEEAGFAAITFACGADQVANIQRKVSDAGLVIIASNEGFATKDPDGRMVEFSISSILSQV